MEESKKLRIEAFERERRRILGNGPTGLERTDAGKRLNYAAANVAANIAANVAANIAANGSVNGSVNGSANGAANEAANEAANGAVIVTANGATGLNGAASVADIGVNVAVNGMDGEASGAVNAANGAGNGGPNDVASNVAANLENLAASNENKSNEEAAKFEEEEPVNGFPANGYSTNGFPANKNTAIGANESNNAKKADAQVEYRRESGGREAGEQRHSRTMKGPIDLAVHRSCDYDKGDGKFNLKRYVHDRIINEIFTNGVDKKYEEQCKQDCNRSFGVYVMLLDNMATGVLGSCLKLHTLGERRVSLVENIDLKRKPLPNMEAIYFIAPIERSVLRLIEDFKSKENRMYKCAHVFFTRKCAEHLFEGISQSPVSAYIRTMKELNVGFFAEESHVFDFNMGDNFFDIYSPVASEVKQQEALDVFSDKILTLCQTLQVCPLIHYQSTPKAFSLALMANRKLEDEDRATNGGLSKNCKNGQVVMVLMDRSMDTITPLLHCMSLQGMVHDILPCESGCFQFEHLDARGKLATKTVILDEEEDHLWSEVRHLHIADVAQMLPRKFQNFLIEHHIIQKDNPTLKDMAEIMKAFPQYHKELSLFAVHMHLTEVCMQRFKKGLHTVVLAEQNLATGINGSNGLPIAQYMPFMAPILTDGKRTHLEKIRLLLLYIILKNGLPETDIDKILEHSNIPTWFKTYVINMSFLGINILTRRSAGHNRPPVKARKIDGGYTTARWTPYIKDIMEDVIERELNTERFPSLENHSINKTGVTQTLPKPEKVICCFLGGVTYSEMNTAYEVSAQTGVDILIGGDELLTPFGFLDKIQKLKRWSHMGHPPKDVLNGNEADF